jgi:hypothetical protein
MLNDHERFVSVTWEINVPVEVQPDNAGRYKNEKYFKTIVTFGRKNESNQIPFQIL